MCGGYLSTLVLHPLNSELGWLLTINPWLPCIIYYIITYKFHYIHRQCSLTVSRGRTGRTIHDTPFLCFLLSYSWSKWSCREVPKINKLGKVHMYQYYYWNSIVTKSVLDLWNTNSLLTGCFWFLIYNWLECCCSRETHFIMHMICMMHWICIL